MRLTDMLVRQKKQLDDRFALTHVFYNPTPEMEQRFMQWMEANHGGVVLELSDKLGDNNLLRGILSDEQLYMEYHDLLQEFVNQSEEAKRELAQYVKTQPGLTDEES